MGEFEELLGTTGVEQWVRNKFVKKLAQFSKDKNTDVDKLIAEFNAELLIDFKVVANQAVTNVITRADELLNKGKVWKMYQRGLYGCVVWFYWVR